MAGCYYKVRQVLQSVTKVYYKVRQVLQSVTDCYYKVRQVLQSVTGCCYKVCQVLQIAAICNTMTVIIYYWVKGWQIYQQISPGETCETM